MPETPDVVRPPMTDLMGRWLYLLDSLDSAGGHIFLLLVLIFVGLALLGWEWTAPKAGEIVTGAFGALLATLKTAVSNRERATTPPGEPEADHG